MRKNDLLALRRLKSSFFTPKKVALFSSDLPCGAFDERPDVHPPPPSFSLLEVFLFFSCVREKEATLFSLPGRSAASFSPHPLSLFEIRGMLDLPPPPLSS